MALLDALALTRALDRHPLDEALRAYAMGRRAHVWIYQAVSAVFTPQYQSDSRWLPVLRDRVLFPMSQVMPISRVLTALVCGTMLPPLGSLGAL
jgi:2-polyprenyl-6-methoxyphenol hydroxylase-like FAD-dependent oxidoreductase